MRRLIPEDEIRLALRRLVAAYLLIPGSALLFPHRSGEWLYLAVLHGIGVLILLQVEPVREGCRWFARRWPRISTAVADWYALGIMPFLYAELATLNRSVHGGRYFDDWVQAWELRLFGGQPSVDLAGVFPIPILSEFLHLFYL
ncbi:MAG: hypothetical protein ACWGSQ_11975, partial [Longimicrobiales bacterium]